MLEAEESCGGLTGRWLNVETTPGECYEMVRDDPTCVSSFYRHATNGDKNCWCFTSGNLDLCQWEGETDWKIWTYKQVPGTYEPTTGPVDGSLTSEPSETTAGTTSSPVDNPTLQPTTTLVSAEPTIYVKPSWTVYREESCDDIPTAWMGVYSTDVNVCMDAILARADCSHTIFKHATGEGGDNNCGCVPPNTQLSMCTFLGPNTWGIWTYLITTNTLEPTITYYDDCSDHVSDEDTIACLRNRVDDLDAEVDALNNQVNSLSGECDATYNELSSILASCT